MTSKMLPPLISILIFIMGSSFFTSYISIRLDTIHMSGTFIGLVGSAYYLGMFLGAFHSSKFITRVGHIRSYATFAAIASSITLLQGLWFVPWTWIPYRIVWGYCVGSLYVLIESWLLKISKDGDKGSSLGLYGFSLYFGMFLGQHLFRFIDDYTTFTAHAITALFVTMSLIPVAYTKVSHPDFEAHTKFDLKKIFITAPAGIINCVCSGFILSTIYILFPLFFYKSGFNKIQVAYFLSLPVLGGSIFQYPFGKLSDCIDRRKVLLVLHILSLFLLPICALFFDSWVLMVALFLFGGFTFSVYPISITYTCDFFKDDKDHVLAVQTLLLVYCLACIIGPIVATLFTSILGSFGIFLFLGMVCISGGIYTFIKMLTTPSIQKSKGSFSFVDVIFPFIGLIYPKNKDK